MTKQRILEGGCLTILAIILMLLISGWLFAQDRLPLRMSTFHVEYSPCLRIPLSCEWVLCAADLGTSRREPSWRFVEDSRAPKPRATHADYTGTHFDRGHMCPAGDRSASREAMRETFVMSNVCPQVPALNRGSWKKLEEACRSMVRHGRAFTIHVDAVFWPADTQFIGRNHVAVPHGFVKTVRDFSTDTICYSKYFQN